MFKSLENLKKQRSGRDEGCGAGLQEEIHQISGNKIGLEKTEDGQQQFGVANAK